MPRFNIATATNPTIAINAQLQTDSPTVARGARTSAAGGAEGFVGVFGLGLNARDPAVPGVAGGVGVVGFADFGVFEGVNSPPKLRTGDSQPLPRRKDFRSSRAGCTLEVNTAFLEASKWLQLVECPIPSWSDFALEMSK